MSQIYFSKLRDVIKYTLVNQTCSLHSLPKGAPTWCTSLVSWYIFNIFININIISYHD